MDLRDLMSWPWAKPADSGGPSSDDAYRALRADINRAVEIFWQQMPSPRLRAGIDLSMASEMRVDVCETDDEIEVTAELPGVAEADIEVSLFERMLLIAAEKKPDHGVEGRTYRINERSFGRVSRSVPLPENADDSGVQAVYRDGVLKVTMPRNDGPSRDVKRVAISKG
ncbi:MAG: Hsp20/alpha crystallin family protein [Rhodospirillales bacterium]|jgi:HSP20 family protein|nr:Hsp20/alpha crystallin family protein [Rhodospirillales bacterium]